ncbi:hypothetical protein K7X08_003101 [Anisodus acutangulus]|uniref:3,4-dihydroxy-2-butanone-4-phosphate synthase n=1 Tax=Anisodus acutangulus TaxID=402998 RepID=A0A9Q1RIE6_9SOLA|nr:hypothetical protein K7X08_003101 [Anisodus acutangulus]
MFGLVFNNQGAENGSFFNHEAEQTGIQNQPFLAGENEFDLDHTVEGFSSIPEAIEDIRQGKMVIVVDDEDRENEGDLIMAAQQLVTPEAMAFMVKYGTGIVCVSMKGEDLDRLQLPLMVLPKENEEKLSTAFTVSVDGKYGTTTGVSAHDRAKTVLALASGDSKPEDFNRPGHVFPAGHTEASVDLAALAGLDPFAVLCEIVDDDGSMARLPRLLTSISYGRYRRKREKLVELAAATPIPTMWGPFKAYCFKSVLDGIEHIAMVKGDIGDGKDVLVRVHSDVSPVTYSGRGIGLGHKLRAYILQDDVHNTVEANEELGLPVDSREYGIGAQNTTGFGCSYNEIDDKQPCEICQAQRIWSGNSGRIPLLAPVKLVLKLTERAMMNYPTMLTDLGFNFVTCISGSCSKHF